MNVEPTLPSLADKIDLLEQRNVERHQEVLRRLTSVEVQTTATNGRVRTLELEQAVAVRLAEQERHYDVTINRDATLRKQRSTLWLIMFASGAMAFITSLVVTAIMILDGHI